VQIPLRKRDLDAGLAKRLVDIHVKLVSNGKQVFYGADEHAQLERE
jgi:hypothetical protein